MTTYPATYCPACGEPLERRSIEGRDRRWCPDCEAVVWHNPVPTAGVAVVDASGVLLTRRAVDPGRGRWAVPGGHLEADESPEAAAARELAEETGVRVDPDALELLDTFFADHGDGKRIVSIGYVVPRSATSGEPAAGREVSDVGWFTPSGFDDTDERCLESHDDRFARAWAWYRRRGSA